MKRARYLLTLCFILAFASNAYASGLSTQSTSVSQLSSSFTQTTSMTSTDTTPSTTTAPASITPSTPTSRFAGLIGNDDGMRPIKPLDLNAMGNRAMNFGDKSFELLQKGSIPLFVWGVGGSVFMMFLGIFFGKKVIIAGVTGVLISLIVVVLIHYMPEIVLSVKSATGSAIAH